MYYLFIYMFDVFIFINIFIQKNVIKFIKRERLLHNILLFF